MDLVTVLQVLRRRWVVFGGALFLTAVTALLLTRLDTATYGSRGAVVIVRGAGAAGAEGNEGADPALQRTAQVLAEIASPGGAAAQAEGAAGATVSVDQSLPILRVTGLANEEAAATESVEAAVESLSQKLEQFRTSGQVSVPDGTVIQTLVPPTEPEARQGQTGEEVQFFSTATLLLSRSNVATGPQSPVSGIIVPSQSDRFVATVALERLNDDAVLEEMAENGATGDFEVLLDDNSAILRVSASSGDRDEALTTGQVVIETLQQVVADIQEADGVPEDLRFTAERLAYPLFAFVSDSARLRTMLAVLALGTLASVGLALMVDAAEARREAHWHLLGPTAADAKPAQAEPWDVWPAEDPPSRATPHDTPSHPRDH